MAIIFVNELMSDIKELRSGWWRELSNLFCKSKPDRIFRREPKVVVIEVRPFIIRHCDVLSQNGLGVLVEKNGTLCETLNSLGVCRLRGRLRSVNHEGCICAGPSSLSAQIGDYGDRRNRADVIQHQIEGQG